MELIRYGIIIVGLILAGLGIFHQLIVGAIVTNIDGDEKDLRLYLMSWISHGAYITFSGILPVILLFYHSTYEGAISTTLIVLGFALLILSIHIAITTLKFKIPMILAEFAFSILLSVLLFTFYFLQ
ncbi:MAG: hypothetical protein NZ853_03485 [Leptospiraceae bacterium]|nr:hypothetical protein [Leptospiraceae bacterium]MDW7975236.1 hypothetical protein [Leptospiraceae bacterium]